MARTTLLLFYLALLSACNNPQANTPQALIIGDWTSIVTRNDSDTVDKILERMGHPDGYEFKPNGICEYKPGYFKEAEVETTAQDRKRFSIKKRTSAFFFGTKTTYTITGNNLKIFNLADSNWQTAKIKSISADTLTLESGNKTITKYIRQHYNIEDKTLFDQVVVSSSGCFGTCPVNDVVIGADGNGIYYGQNYNNKSGLYYFHLQNGEFDDIETSFKKAGTMQLSENNAADVTDNETVSLTFFKNGKIIKKIEDYGNVTPVEFQWVYGNVRNLYQVEKLDTISSIKPPLIGKYGLTIFFGEELGLSKSAAFYLWNLTRLGKATNQNFAKKYEIDLHGINNIKTVETDGRFYAFNMMDSTKTTIDIGYNFFAGGGARNSTIRSTNVKFFN